MPESYAKVGIHPASHRVILALPPDYKAAVSMTADDARELAALLIRKADELDRVGVICEARAEISAGVK